MKLDWQNSAGRPCDGMDRALAVYDQINRYQRQKLRSRLETRTGIRSKAGLESKTGFKSSLKPMTGLM